MPNVEPMKRPNATGRGHHPKMLPSTTTPIAGLAMYITASGQRQVRATATPSSRVRVSR